VLTAVEKRFNFAVGDTEPKAHAFEYFLSLLESDGGWDNPATDKGPQLAATPLECRRVPQWLRYERGRDLELWVLKLRT
jgi:hypothetical protein